MKHFVLAATLVAAPVIASASTVSLTAVEGKSVTGVGMLYPDTTLTFDIAVSAPMDLSFSLASTGDFEDLQEVTYSYTVDGVTSDLMSFAVTGSADDPSAGSAFLDLSATSDVLLTFYDGVANAVGISVTAAGESPAPVPLPAAGLLLAAALGGLGAVRAKKRRDA